MLQAYLDAAAIENLPLLDTLEVNIIIGSDRPVSSNDIGFSSLILHRVISDLDAVT